MMLDQEPCWAGVALPFTAADAADPFEFRVGLVGDAMADCEDVGAFDALRLSPPPPLLPPAPV